MHENVIISYFNARILLSVCAPHFSSDAVLLHPLHGVLSHQERFRSRAFCLQGSHAPFKFSCTTKGITVS